MNRFEQRLQKRLQNEEIATSYREMSAELELMQALDKEGEAPIKVAITPANSQ